MHGCMIDNDVTLLTGLDLINKTYNPCDQETGVIERLVGHSPVRNINTSQVCTINDDIASDICDEDEMCNTCER